MAFRHFAPIPQDVFISFGGFSCPKPDEWECYLTAVIQQEYPDYFLKSNKKESQARQWRVEQSCILEAVEKYLLEQFGVLVPEENLFKIYNEKGQGVGLDQILEAISAVVEPLGFEIDLVLATDSEIRAGLGESERIIDGGVAERVNGKPGICMINIEAGYSHAFYWPKIDARGFKDARFRMVVLLKRKSAPPVPFLSAFDSAVAFLRFVEGFLKTDPYFLREHRDQAFEVKKKVEALRDYLQDGKNPLREEFRTEVDSQLVAVLNSFLDAFAEHSLSERAATQRAGLVYAAGQMVRKVFREVEVLY